MISELPKFDFSIVYDDTVKNAFEKYRFFQRRSGMRKSEDAQSRFRHGDTLTANSAAEIEEYSTVAQGNSLFTIGAFASVASALPSYAKVGRYSSIAPGLSLMGYKHPIFAVSQSSAIFNHRREFMQAYIADNIDRLGDGVVPPQISNPQLPRTLQIGNDVWIGADCLIAPNVKIGDGAVIASRSVVVKDVPPYTIVGGSPARPIRLRFDENVVARLIETEWWKYEIRDIWAAGIDFECPERFLAAFTTEYSRLRKASFRRFSPIHLDEIGTKPLRLFTVHGHVLRLKERSLSTDREYLVDESMVLASQDIPGYEKIVNADGTVSFSKEGRFVSITRGGRVVMAEKKGAWEKFIPL
ncbi:CatB-related O-acetyltransferase [Falsirhodobacter sp. alg1]|uniref:CatB-related O-acetyltransferase n=1 Tax=Falsirhodobacter sp. alg1 TaxID=1472418 RepID=UPI000788E63D|nr:CatB-related O-acetyltransferase [Falsirhodobacter sp. alg1]